MIIQADQAGINQAVEAMKAGKVIVFPTETLYGLGCLATDEKAIKRIFAIKGRPDDKALPLIFGSVDQAAQWVEIPFKAMGLVMTFWPGPLTLVLKTKKTLPQAVAPLGRAAVRVSPNKTASALADGLGAPLVATSANRTGFPAAVTAKQAATSLIDPAPDLIVDSGPVAGGPPSTILDLTGSEPTILREGAIPGHFLEPSTALFGKLRRTK